MSGFGKPKSWSENYAIKTTQVLIGHSICYGFGISVTLFPILFFEIVCLSFVLFCSFLIRINSLISFLSMSVNGGLCIIKSTPSGSFIKPIIFKF